MRKQDLAGSFGWRLLPGNCERPIIRAIGCFVRVIRFESTDQLVLVQNNLGGALGEIADFVVSCAMQKTAALTSDMVDLLRTYGVALKRREFITMLCGIAAAWPYAGRAQQSATKGRMSKIGVLWHAGSRAEEGMYFDVLMKAFGDLGYVDGRNAVFQHRFPAEQAEGFRLFARELVDERPDVIVAVSAQGAIEVKHASGNVPIVVVLAPDPVREGLVESLAHPGGNVTGLSLMSTDLSGKRIALLQEAVPNLTRLALIYDSHFSASAPAVVNAAKAAGIELRTVPVPAPDAIGESFSSVAQDGFQAVIIIGSMLYNERVRTAAAALANRIPTQAGVGEMVQNDGILMSYGQDFPDYFRKAAGYADKILKGASPKDLPVEQPTRFKLVLNLKTAKAIGLAIPTSLLVEADEVIE